MKREHTALTLILALALGFAIRGAFESGWRGAVAVAVLAAVFLRRYWNESKSERPSREKCGALAPVEAEIGMAVCGRELGHPGWHRTANGDRWEPAAVGSPRGGRGSLSSP